MLTRYRQGRFTFDPPAWEERVIHAFVHPKGGERLAFLVVAHEPLLAAETLGQQMRRALEEIAAQVTGCELHGIKDVEYAGRRARRAEVVWIEGHDVIQQTRVHFAAAAGERSVVTVAYTSLRAEHPLHLQAFEHVLMSAKFTGSPAFTGPPPLARPAFPSQLGVAGTDFRLPCVPMPGTSSRLDR
jgi:hypothetical protein